MTRFLVVLTALLWPLQSLPAETAGREAGTRLILLGTGGGPLVHVARSQPANLLVVDGRPYLIDCGDGTVRQLKLAGFAATDISRVFLTHLHFDHVADLSSLLGFNWVSGKRQKIEILGPVGTTSFVQQAVRYLDIPEYLYAAQLPPHPDMIDISIARELDAAEPRLVYQDDKVKVTAVENSHFSTMGARREPYRRSRSYSYRFETADRTIVFTGDTGPSPAVAALARGADILLSEVIDLDAVKNYMRGAFNASDTEMRDLIVHQEQEHLSPEEVGKLARDAGVKMVVLSHVSPSDDIALDSLRYTSGVKKFFQGPVVLGRDLDQF